MVSGGMPRSAAIRSRGSRLACQKATPSRMRRSVMKRARYSNHGLVLSAGLLIASMMAGCEVAESSMVSIHAWSKPCLLTISVLKLRTSSRVLSIASAAGANQHAASVPRTTATNLTVERERRFNGRASGVNGWTAGYRTQREGSRRWCRRSSPTAVAHPPLAGCRSPCRH